MVIARRVRGVLRRLAIAVYTAGLAIQPVASRSPVAALVNNACRSVAAGIDDRPRLVDEFGGTEGLYCVVEMFGTRAPVHCGILVEIDNIEQEIRRYDEVCASAAIDDNVCRCGETALRPGMVNP